MSKKVVLGFSGGLDTSYCVKYLSEEKGYEVHSIIVNTGGFSAVELEEIEKHAYKLGVKTHVTIDAVKGYYDSIIKYLIYGNVLKNNTYPLSVSAERLSQALHIAEHAKKLNADAVAHAAGHAPGSMPACKSRSFRGRPSMYRNPYPPYACTPHLRSIDRGK